MTVPTQGQGRTPRDAPARCARALEAPGRAGWVAPGPHSSGSPPPHPPAPLPGRPAALPPRKPSLCPEPPAEATAGPLHLTRRPALTLLTGAALSTPSPGTHPPAAGTPSNRPPALPLPPHYPSLSDPGPRLGPSSPSLLLVISMEFPGFQCPLSICDPPDSTSPSQIPAQPLTDLAPQHLGGPA